MSKDESRELVEKVTIEGITLEIDGYYDDNTPKGEYEWYDVFHCGVCVNEGDPLFERPTELQLEEIVKHIKREYVEGDWR